MEFHARNMTALEGDLMRERLGLVGLPVVYAKTLFAWCLAELGQFAEAITHANDGLRIAGTIDHRYSQIFAIWGVGYPYLRQGNFDEAIGPLERGLQLCEASVGPLYFSLIAALLGAAYARLGRLSEGLPLLEQALEIVVTKGVRGHNTAMYFVLLGEAYLLAGRTDEAFECANRALDLARTNRERGCEAWALRLLGEICSQRDRDETVRAEGHYRDALSLADQLGMQPVVAHCQLGLGRLDRRGENWSRAAEHLTAATTLFGSMDMVFWHKQAEAELKQLESPT
jgi:tetratricopeptide (TPR) repeat protein